MSKALSRREEGVVGNGEGEGWEGEERGGEG